MKIIPVENTLITNTKNVGAQSTIKNSAKAFRILSGLYPDIKEAVIREIICNAYDSHIEAGKGDVPFRVHLPTVLEPWFEVQDFGVGLSKDQIMGYNETVQVVNDKGEIEEQEVYVPGLVLSYFDSTKNDSNESIGGLGLGFKSPLAYVDQFHVTSVFGGLKSQYVIFIGEEGIPEVRHLGDSQTDCCNGVTIRIPVQANDVFSFGDRLRKILCWFDRHPEINDDTFQGISYKECDNHESYILPEGRLIVDSGFYRGIRILMGNVLYSIPHNLLEEGLGSLGDQEKALLITVFATCPFVLKVPIGEMDVAPARDQVLSCKTSTKNFKKRLGEAATELYNDMVGGLFQCSSYREVWEFLKTLQKDIRSCIVSQFPWNGKVLQEHNLNCAPRWTPTMVQTKPINIGFDSLRRISTRFKVQKRVECDTIPLHEESRFFVIDTKKHVVAARREFLSLTDENGKKFEGGTYQINIKEWDGFVKYVKGKLNGEFPFEFFLSSALTDEKKLAVKPSSAASSRPRGHRIELVTKATSTTDRWGIRELKEHLAGVTGRVFAASMSYGEVVDGPIPSRVRPLMNDDDVYLICPPVVYANLIRCGMATPIVEMPLSDEQKSQMVKTVFFEELFNRRVDVMSLLEMKEVYGASVDEEVLKSVEGLREYVKNRKYFYYDWNREWASIRTEVFKHRDEFVDRVSREMDRVMARYPLINQYGGMSNIDQEHVKRYVALVDSGHFD